MRLHILSIITRVIIEILLFLFVENGVICCYYHLARGGYSVALIFKLAA